MTVEFALSVVTRDRSVNGMKDFEMVFNDVGNEAGQVVWKSKSMIQNKEDMFHYGITLLKLTCRQKDGTKENLWEHHSPNKSRSLRPVFLIRESETDEDLLSLAVPNS